MNTLKEEIEFYHSIRADLLTKYEGKFVLIKGKKRVGIFNSAEDAYSKGLNEFGNVPFLIQKITRNDTAEFIPYLSLGF